MIIAAALLVYSVTYVEVLPASRAEAVAALVSYREAMRQETGNLRCEVVSRVGQPHQLVVLEVWQDQAAFEAHAKAASTGQTRDRLQAIRAAPIDERVHTGVSVGPLTRAPRATRCTW